MLYYDESDISFIFSVIAEHYTKQEEVPDYIHEQSGINKLLGVFERAQSDLYPTLLDKVVYFFIQINKGHFFSNGNKRLALVTALGFLNMNDMKVAGHSRETFINLLSESFPGCEDSLEDQEDFSAEEFALYNLSIIVADSHKYVSGSEGFDVLKKKVTSFFKNSVESNN